VDVAIVFDKEGVGDKRDGCIQGDCDRVPDHVHNCSFEENSEQRGQVRPESSSDVELDVISVDVNDHIDSVNHHQLAASSGGNLGLELKAEPDVYGVHIYLHPAVGNHERGDLVAEVVGSEFGSQLVAVQSDGVFGDVSSEDNVVESLFNVEVVVLHVVLAIPVDVGDGDSVHDLDYSVEPLVSSLLQDRQIE